MPELAAGAFSAPLGRPRWHASIGASAGRLTARVPLPHVLAISAAGVCWATALAGTDPTGVSGFGLLAALPPQYFAALLLLAVGFAFAAARPRVQPTVLGAYVIALVVVLHATTAVLYPEARYAWTYKHVGVIDYLLAHGHVDRSIDIYQNWPGFFSLSGWLSRTAGVSPLAMAPWAQVFFELANVAAVLFAMRGITRDRRVQWTAVWLFVVANWIAQDYLAPQAFGFFLATVVLGLVLRCAPWARPPRTALGWAVVRLVNRAGEAAARGRLRRHQREAAPLGAPVALALGAVCCVAVVVSHQLSPIMLIASILALAAMTRRPPLWIVGVLIAVNALWIALGFDFVSRHFHLFELNASTTARSSGGGIAGVALGAGLSRASLLLMVALAVAGFVRRLRAGYWDATPIALAAAPAFVVLFQSYGGEGPARAYLFALPWLAFLAAAAIRPSFRRQSALRRAWPLVAVTALVGTGTLFGYFGQEPLNYMTHDDVAASRWFLDRAPSGSSLTEVVPNIPDRSDANYARFLDEPRSLVDSAAFRAHLGSPALAVRDAKSFLQSDGAKSRFLIITPSQMRYARYYGLATEAGFARLASALRASPDFTPVYRHGQAVVLLFTPARERTASRGPRRGAG